MKRFGTRRSESGNMTPVSNLRRAQHLVEVTGDYPLEVGLALWASIVGTLTLFFDPPSTSLAHLPDVLDTTWAIAMLVGSASTVYGLRARSISPAISNAMFLFSIAFAVYGTTVIAVSGWRSGGAVSGLTITLAVVCYLRSRRLRELWRILLAEGERLHHADGTLELGREKGES